MPSFALANVWGSSIRFLYDDLYVFENTRFATTTYANRVLCVEMVKNRYFKGKKINTHNTKL